MQSITHLGQSTGRRAQLFGIKDTDRLAHLYVIGATGSGKTSLLHAMFEADSKRGVGVVLLDPHGDLAESLYQALKKSPETNKRLVYIDIADPECPYGFNPVMKVSEAYIPLVVSGLMDALKTLFADAWGSRMEGVLRAALYAVVEAGNCTLPDVLRILIDKDFREEIISRISNETVIRYWREEFKDINPKLRAEMVLPVQNKISALLCDPRLLALFTRTENTLRFRKLLDDQAIVIINLSKGKLGVDSASLIGSMILTTLSMAALSRAELPQENRRKAFIYADECHLLAVSALMHMATELRKYKVGLVLAHQSTTQIGSMQRDIILGTVGSVIAFRVGLEDAGYFAKAFGKHLTPTDFLNLPARNAYAKVLVDGVPTPPFSMETLSIKTN